MTDLKSLLAERRAKFNSDSNLVQKASALFAYVDLLEKVIERQDEALTEVNEGTSAQLDNLFRYFKNKRCPTLDELNQFCSIDSNLRVTITEVRRMLTEENK